jgi:lipopolysaccharide/colanic/teichoic acid biosynthesis glycosyltransferase
MNDSVPAMRGSVKEESSLFVSGRRSGGGWNATEVVPQHRLETGAETAIAHRLAIGNGHQWYRSFKRVVEVAAALVLLVILSPIILVAALLVRLMSHGPAFYSQMRVGRYGRPFRIFKIRTMLHQCETVSGACWSRPGDPRVTPVGRVLRLTHVDELPQLINVLLGDMSLIGPRPERPEFLPVLEQALAGYRERLQVRPGVTGLAQIQLPPDTDLASVQRKLAYDLFYIQRENPLLDVRILLGTLTKVLGIPFAISRRILFLPTLETIADAVYGPPRAMPPRISA